MLKYLRSTWSHNENPYLKIGPFKLEYLHQNPEIVLIHDFASETQTDEIIEKARGQTKSTPYISNGVEKSYSKKRTSKVMYMNELLVPEVMKVSTKIEMITKLFLKSDQYASENYQAMNYGIGGKISSHVDTMGIRFDEKCR